MIGLATRPSALPEVDMASTGSNLNTRAARASITLTNDMAETERLASFIEAFAARQGIGAEDTARLQVILEELLTNVVKYGYDPDSGRGTIDVSLARDGERLAIEFSDDGRAFDPLTHAAPDLQKPVEERAVGGLGLHLIRAMTDEAHYRREAGRNHLSLERRLAP